jgi:GNAT superfamily N-acetyltransferase
MSPSDPATGGSAAGETRPPAGRPGRGATIVVRPAGADDARSIAEINVAGWRAAYRGLMPDEFLDSLSVDQRELAWRSRLESGEDAGDPAWVAELNGAPIGYLASGPPRDDDVEASSAEIYAVYVAPDRWRAGAGRRLMETAASEWWRRGATSLRLWVLEGNSGARAFYESLGWVADGSRKSFDMGGFATVEVRYRLAR